MPLEKARAAEVIKKFQKHPSDTASPQVQVALLTERLAYLNTHFKGHARDHHSRRGLLKIVGRRRRLLDYLKQRDAEAYRTLIAELGLRK